MLPDPTTINKVSPTPPPTPFTASDLMREENARQWREDDEARREPALRLQSAKLLLDLEQSLNERAAELATMRKPGRSDAFDDDEAAVDLLWQLLEALTRSFIERSDDDSLYGTMLRPYQMTKRHIASLFDLDIDHKAWKSTAGEIHLDEVLTVSDEPTSSAAGEGENA